MLGGSVRLRLDIETRLQTRPVLANTVESRGSGSRLASLREDEDLSALARGYGEELALGIEAQVSDRFRNSSELPKLCLWQSYWEALVQCRKVLLRL